MSLLDNLDNDIETLLDKVPQSVMETPWKKTLFWIVFGSFAVAVILLFVIFGLLFGLLKVIFDPDKSSSQPYSNEDNDLTQAEIDARVTNDELGMIHQHYEINEFGTIEGLKDPEW